MEILQIIWFILIGVLFIGYSILDGFDLGVGTLLPFLSKNEGDSKKIFNAIGPLWDGNEVWLLTAGGALFAAFPHAYATVFSGFYLALMLVLFAMIFRAVSLEFWSLEEKSKLKWQWTFVIGSALPSLLFGVALGNIIQGIPLDDKMEFTGNFFTLLRPLPLSIGLLGLAAILLQGSAFAALKTSGGIQSRARALVSKISIGYLALLVLAVAVSIIILPDVKSNIAGWVSLLIVAAAVLLAKKFSAQGKDFTSFIMSSVSFLGLWLMTGSYIFPNLVKSVADPKLSITIFNGSSSTLTLKVMLAIALIGMPLVIGYTAYVYRVFKGKSE